VPELVTAWNAVASAGGEGGIPGFLAGFKGPTFKRAKGGVENKRVGGTEEREGKGIRRERR